MNVINVSAFDWSDPLIQTLFTLLLKTSLLLLTAQLVVMLFRRSSASLRHAVLSLALVGALILPALVWFSPAWSLAVLPNSSLSSAQVPNHAVFLTMADKSQPNMNSISAMPNSLSSTAQNAAVSTPDVMPHLASTGATGAPTAPAPFLSVSSVILFTWLVGVGAILLRWMRQFTLVWRATRRAFPVDAAWMKLLDSQKRGWNIRRSATLLVSDEVRVPMTWGMWHPVILLPVEAAAWNAARRRVVLLHELAHVARWDYLTQWIVLVSCALNWFNPLVWKTARQCAVERERASDDLVLNAGVRGTEYAGHLLDIARQAVCQPSFLMIGLAMARCSDLERRIKGILNTRQNRNSPRRTRGGVMVALTLLVMTLGGMRLSHVAAQSDSITLTLAGPGGETFANQTGLLDDFKAAHPGVNIVFKEGTDVPDAADGLDAHFEALEQYANSADVLIFDGYRLSLSPFATRAGYVLDLAPLVQADTSFSTDDFYPQMWNAFQWDNGIWGIPLSGDVVVLTYDQTMFDKAGIAYPDEHWTLDDLVNAATRLTAKDENGNVIQTGFANSGRVFRESFWRTFMTADAVDASVIPNNPQFDRPDIESIIDLYRQLEGQGIIGSDPTNAAMYVDVAQKAPPSGHGWALLPGGKSVLLPIGVAISAGTQHPELAYELIKYLTTRQEFTGVRKSNPGGPRVLPAYEALYQQALANSLTYSNLRFMDYLNDAWGGLSDGTTVKDALHAAESRAFTDIQTADSKHGTLTLAVNEPATQVLPAGKIALKFDMVSFTQPLPNQDRWNQVMDDFATADPQVGLVNMRVVSESPSMAAASSDCFYLSDNSTATLDNRAVLALDPLVNADPSFDRSDFMGNVLTAVQRGNQVYALPIDIEPFILRYDSARFAAVNLPEPSNTWTTEQFTDALTALKPTSQGQAPFVDNGSGGTYLLVLIAGYGGLPLDYRTNPPTVNFTDPATVTAIRQVLDLAKNGYIRYSALGNFDGSTGAPATNTTAIYPSMLNGFGRKIPPGTAPDKAVLFPAGHQYNGLAYQLGTAYISTQAQSPEACYRFISTLAQHPELFSAMPVRHSQLANPTFQAATNPDMLALYQQVETLLNDSRTIAIPVTEKGGKDVSNFLVVHWLFEAFDTYVLNGGDLDAALKEDQDYAQAYETCSANLPPVDPSDVKGGGTSSLVPYVDCAEQADARLKPILDPLVNR